MNKHIGSKFDDFLKEESLLDEAEAVAIKKVLAYQLQIELKKSIFLNLSWRNKCTQVVLP